jgi:hypothetical protein
MIYKSGAAFRQAKRGAGFDERCGQGAPRASATKLAATRGPYIVSPVP